MARPDDLPEYGAPPLNEVVLGIQFRTPDSYSQIMAGDIWKLYREKFPLVNEHQKLPPSFETFGPASVASTKFELIDSAQHDRFWFMTHDGTELLQFQDDRFLQNWRRHTPVETIYPRFDTMVDEFRSYATQLEGFFRTIGGPALEITQVELSYINHFSPLPDQGFGALQDYIRLVQEPPLPSEDMAIRYRRTISTHGQPTGRLYVSSEPIVTIRQEYQFSLNLVVRGAPQSTSLDGAIDYLRTGREVIVKEFSDITTAKAQNLWKRLK